MVKRVLIGKFGTGYALRVSRPGYDVLGALTHKELAFDSAWSGTIRVRASGIYQFSSGQDRVERTVTIATFPNLGVRPLVVIHEELNDGNGWVNYFRTTDTSLIATTYVHVSVNYRCRYWVFDSDIML